MTWEIFHDLRAINDLHNTRSKLESEHVRKYQIYQGEKKQYWDK